MGPSLTVLASGAAPGAGSGCISLGELPDPLDLYGDTAGTATFLLGKAPLSEPEGC